MPIAILYGSADTIFPYVEWEQVSEDKLYFQYKLLEGAKHGQASGERVWDYILKFQLQNTAVSPNR